MELIQLITDTSKAADENKEPETVPNVQYEGVSIQPDATIIPSQAAAMASRPPPPSLSL